MTEEMLAGTLNINTKNLRSSLSTVLAVGEIFHNLTTKALVSRKA